MKQTFAVVSLLISLGANVPYIIEILQGKVRPERISWLLWTILGGIYFFSAIVDEGATLYTLGEVLAPVVIFALALKFGVGGKSRFDLISLAAACVALALLFVFDGTLVSLLLALFVDGIGGLLTIRKLRLDPTSESKTFWSMAAVSAVFALASLRSYTLVATLFPAYVLGISVCILLEIRSGKSHQEKIENL